MLSHQPMQRKRSLVKAARQPRVSLLSPLLLSLLLLLSFSGTALSMSVASYGTAFPPSGEDKAALDYLDEEMPLLLKPFAVTATLRDKAEQEERQSDGGSPQGSETEMAHNGWEVSASGGAMAKRQAIEHPFVAQAW